MIERAYSSREKDHREGRHRSKTHTIPSLLGSKPRVLHGFKDKSQSPYCDNISTDTWPPFWPHFSPLFTLWVPHRSNRIIHDAQTQCTFSHAAFNSTQHVSLLSSREARKQDDQGIFFLTWYRINREFYYEGVFVSNDLLSNSHLLLPSCATSWASTLS